jgi:SAM-dependent methyltransferase
MSPARLYSDHFLDTVLPQLEPRRQLDVLEIGCGSGSLCRRLAGLGFSGTYTGLDIGDRFDRTPVAGFSTEFIRADATAWRPDRRFDLVISVSALEHIPDDRLVIARARDWLRPGGAQVHIVPSGWALPLYLWHGYRQYHRRAIAERFAPGATTYRLGGACGFVLHFLFITLAEMLLKLPVRRRLTAVYGRLLSWSRADSTLGCVPANLYAIVERAP